MEHQQATGSAEQREASLQFQRNQLLYWHDQHNHKIQPVRVLKHQSNSGCRVVLLQRKSEKSVNTSDVLQFHEIPEQFRCTDCGSLSLNKLERAQHSHRCTFTDNVYQNNSTVQISWSEHQRILDEKDQEIERLQQKRGDYFDECMEKNAEIQQLRLQLENAKRYRLESESERDVLQSVLVQLDELRESKTTQRRKIKQLKRAMCDLESKMLHQQHDRRLQIKKELKRQKQQLLMENHRLCQEPPHKELIEAKAALSKLQSKYDVLKKRRSSHSEDVVESSKDREMEFPRQKRRRISENSENKLWTEDEYLPKQNKEFSSLRGSWITD